MQPGQSRELLRTRCSDGWLVITDTAIRVERKGILGAGGMSKVLPRQSLTGAALKNTMPGAFGKGGACTLTFSGMGMTIEAKMVVTADAQRTMELLGYA